MTRIPEIDLEHGRLDEMVYGAIASRLIVTAIDLGVFDVLRKPRTHCEVAQALETHPGNTLHMLRALTACGLLCRRDDRFVNGQEAAVFLDSRSPSCVGEWLQRSMWTFSPIIDSMRELVKSGPPPQRPDRHMNSEAMCELYTHSHARTELAGIARRTAALVTSLPEFEGLERMLDLGGGPGLNSVAVLQEHPSLTSVVFDRESVVNIARGYIERFGMAERIETMAGDYGRDDLGDGYDLILASDTLYYPRENLDRIVARLFDALNPGGVLVGIHGVLTDGKTAPAAMVLGMLPEALTDRGELPDSGFLAPSLFAAGFTSVHTRTVRMISSMMELDVARRAHG